MKTCKRWTESDLKILKTFCSLGINAVKKRLPKRTESAIRVKCVYLGLTLGDVYEVKERFYMVV